MNGKLMAWPGNNFFCAIDDYIFPRTCLSCGGVGKFLCPLCSSKIDVKSVSLCPICKTEACQAHHSDINRLYALSDYHQRHIDQLVTNIKYKYLVGLIEEFWQEKLEEFCLKYQQEIINKLIIPIPLHPQKLLRRGFNQSELIAKIVAEYSECRINNKLLCRVKNNPPQAEQSGVNRLQNVRDIFGINYRELADCWGREIILIDDVYTTGATALEAARELRKLGFKKVDCLVLAVSRA